MSGVDESDDPLLGSLVDRAQAVTLKSRAMDAAPVGITIADMREDDQPLIYVNEGFERLTGYSAEWTVGRNCRFLQGEGTEAEPVARMREAIESGEPVQVELRNYRKDGTRFWNEVTLAPVSGEDGVPYYVGFQQDVTDRKEYERQLERQRDDLEFLNQMLRHDIRNDLQVVLATLEMFDPEVPETAEADLDTALESIHQAIDLTMVAGDLAEAMQSSDATLERTSLAHVLPQVVDNTQSEHPDATVRIDGNVPAAEVRADRMLASLFRNLLNNAIQHNDSTTPEVTVSVTTSDDHVEVTVADNGPGVPEELRGEVFAKGATGEDSQSTGLGLYLVRRLADSYDGEVRIEDNDPRGAAFVVTLPRAG